MARRRGDTQTMDLLAWQPRTEPIKRFRPEVTRAASLRAAISKMVAQSLKDCDRSRDDVAAAMGAYLGDGEVVPKSMLDAYASEARDDHVISLLRFLALAHATGDAQRLLQGLAEHFGLAVIPERFVPAIRAEMLRDQIEHLQREEALARRSWKGAGG